MATQKLSQTSLAQVSDLEASWKPLNINSDKVRAEALLLQASNYLRQIAFNNGKDLDDMIKADPTGVYGANVRLVVISAVQREMASPVDMMPDASQWSQSASPYSESMSFSGNVTSTIYFKDKELKLLGLGSVSGKVSTSVMRGVR
jgi:hypothetical protein